MLKISRKLRQLCKFVSLFTSLKNEVHSTLSWRHAYLKSYFIGRRWSKQTQCTLLFQQFLNLKLPWDQIIRNWMHDLSQNMAVHTLYGVVYRKSLFAHFSFGWCVIKMPHFSSVVWKLVVLVLFCFVCCFLTILEIENGRSMPASNAFMIALISSYLFPYNYLWFQLKKCHVHMPSFLFFI